MPATAIMFVSIGVGTCPCHPVPLPAIGPVITGSVDHTIEGSGIALLGLSLVNCSCGHVAPIVSTSKLNNTTNGIPKAEVTSIFSACPTGIIITGASTAF